MKNELPNEPIFGFDVVGVSPDLSIHQTNYPNFSRFVLSGNESSEELNFLVELQIQTLEFLVDLTELQLLSLSLHLEDGDIVGRLAACELRNRRREHHEKQFKRFTIFTSMANDSVVETIECLDELFEEIVIAIRCDSCAGRRRCVSCAIGENRND